MRRDAKSRARATGTMLAKALDQIAADHGYRNWSLLQKHGCLPADQPQPWIFRRTTEEVARSMHDVPERADPDTARSSIRVLDGKFIGVGNAVDFAIAYVEAILSQQGFLSGPSSAAYWEMRYWLPYGAMGVDGAAHILVNREYMPQGYVSQHDVRFEDCPQLWLQLESESWRSFAFPGATQPFLFNDGCPPWASRVAATAYLGRLKELRRQL